MKIKSNLVGLCLLVAAPLPNLFAQGTAFTYQGRLSDGANLATGLYDLRFAIYDAVSGGAQQGNLITNAAVGVSNGLFTVTLDFGNQFPGANRFLEISVRTNGAASFFTLAPRQALTPAPYAITAGSVISGGLAAGTYGNATTFNNPANQFTGVFTGNGANLSNVNAGSFGGLATSNFWQTGGNSGTSSNNFLGTTDTQSFEVRVGGARVLRLENLQVSGISVGGPNVIAGSPQNQVLNGSFGATISGGGATNDFYDGVNSTNIVTGNFGTVGGGANNTAGAASTVSGGSANFTWDGGNAIAGGFRNYANGAGLAAIGGGQRNAGGLNDVGIAMVIGGGENNTNVATFGTIGGGYLNFSSNYCSTVPGGFSNSASADFTFAAGNRANAKHVGTFVWADSIDAPFASTATNQFLIRAGGGVGIGTTNPVFPLTVGTPDTPLTTTAQIGAFNSGNAFVVARQTAANVELQVGVDNLEGVLSVVSDHPLVFRAGNGSGTGNHEFMRINTNGFVGIGTSSPTNKLHVAGGVSATVFVTTSDRNAKENFENVSASEVLDKVIALPITKWMFKEMPGQKHLGPMAQDFHAAFGLGADETGIATVDESGVALAAIQGLNQKLTEELNRQQTENAALKQKNESLEKRLEALEEILLKQNPIER